MCSKMWNIEKPETSYLQEIESYENNNHDYSHNHIEHPETKEKSLNITNLIFVILLFSIFFYYGYTKQWFKNYKPKWVFFKTLIYRNKTNQRVLMRLTVVNNTNSSKTFLAPNIYFKKLNKTREFQIKTDVFPVTLTEGTSQEITIDIEQFWEKIDELKKFDSIGASIQEQGGKTYRTWAKPKWLIFNR